MEGSTPSGPIGCILTHRLTFTFQYVTVWITETHPRVIKPYHLTVIKGTMVTVRKDGHIITGACLELSFSEQPEFAG